MADADTASRLPSQPPPKRFALTGRSVALDPAIHAFRSDVADIALAGKVIASHYAEPVIRSSTKETALLAEGVTGAEAIRRLAPNERFAVLACGRGFAWGFAIADHRVGYVDEDHLA